MTTKDNLQTYPQEMQEILQIEHEDLNQAYKKIKEILLKVEDMGSSKYCHTKNIENKKPVRNLKEMLSEGSHFKTV